MDPLQLQIIDLFNPNAPSILDSLILFITLFGEWWLLALVGVGVFLKDKALGKTLLVALVLTAVIVFPIKLLAQEERPWVGHSEIREMGNENPTSSFPSGHAAFSFSYFMVLTKRKKQTILLLSLAILVSLTRLYLGQHYPHDLAAGALIGIATGVVATRFFKVNETS